MNYTKKISAAALLLMFSLNASAQSLCTSTVQNASAGSLSGTIVRMADNNCGGNGSLCFESSDDLTTSEANRAYAAALTALATGATVQVAWDSSVRACGNVPVVQNFRILAPQ